MGKGERKIGEGGIWRGGGGDGGAMRGATDTTDTENNQICGRSIVLR